MDVIKTYVENLYKDLPRTKEVKLAQSNLSQMMTHRYNELIAQGSTHNAAMSEVILTYGDLSTVAPELGIAELIQKQSEPLSKEEANSFLNQMKRFSRTATSSAVIVLWAAIQILILSSLKTRIDVWDDPWYPKIIICSFLFFIPLLTALVLFLKSYLKILNNLISISRKMPDVDTIDQAFDRQKENKKRIIIGIILLIIAILVSMIVQITMFNWNDYCAYNADYCGNHYIELYGINDVTGAAIFNIASLFLMIVSIALIVPSYIDDFAYRRLKGEEFEDKFRRIVTFSWVYWLVVSLLFIFFPSPFEEFSYIIDYWPWAMALYMLILSIWNLFSREKKIN